MSQTRVSLMYASFPLRPTHKRAHMRHIFIPLWLPALLPLSFPGLCASGWLLVCTRKTKPNCAAQEPRIRRDNQTSWWGKLLSGGLLGQGYIQISQTRTMADTAAPAASPAMRRDMSMTDMSDLDTGDNLYHVRKSRLIRLINWWQVGFFDTRERESRFLIGRLMWNTCVSTLS